MFKKLDLQFFAEKEVPELPDTQKDEPAAEPKNPDSEPSVTQPKPIPYERFREVNDAYKSFKSLGFDTPDALKEQLAKLAEYEKAEDERKKSEMSEVERLQAEYEEAQKKLKEFEESSKQTKEQAEKRIIETEIKSIARALNANDPNDVLALIDKSGIKLDDNGNVTGADEVIKSFKEAKPFYFKQSYGADAAGGSNPPKNPSANEITVKEKELAEAQDAARRNPRLGGKVTQLYQELLALKTRK